MTRELTDLQKWAKRGYAIGMSQPEMVKITGLTSHCINKWVHQFRMTKGKGTPEQRKRHEKKFNPAWEKGVFPSPGKGNNGNPTHGEYIGGKKKRLPLPQVVAAEAESKGMCVLKAHLETIEVIRKQMAKRAKRIAFVENELSKNPEAVTIERIHSTDKHEKGEKDGKTVDIKTSEVTKQKIKLKAELDGLEERQRLDATALTRSIDAYHRAENDRAKLAQEESVGTDVDKLAALFGGMVDSGKGK